MVLADGAGRLLDASFNSASLGEAQRFDPTLDSIGQPAHLITDCGDESNMVRVC